MIGRRDTGRRHNIAVSIRTAPLDLAVLMGKTLLRTLRWRNSANSLRIGTEAINFAVSFPPFTSPTMAIFKARTGANQGYISTFSLNTARLISTSTYSAIRVCLTRAGTRWDSAFPLDAGSSFPTGLDRAIASPLTRRGAGLRLAADPIVADLPPGARGDIALNIEKAHPRASLRYSTSSLDTSALCPTALKHTVKVVATSRRATAGRRDALSPLTEKLAVTSWSKAISRTFTTFRTSRRGRHTLPLITDHLLTALIGGAVAIAFTS